MNEKPESDEFEDEDAKSPSSRTATSISIRSSRTWTLPSAAARRAAAIRPGAASSGCKEDKHTAELTSDFEDYEIGDEGDPPRKARGKNGR